MNEYYIDTANIKSIVRKLKAGDKVYLSGQVYTARDAAHKRIFELIDRGEDLPFKIENSVIYYAGPTPAPEGMPIGSAGPTTSARMDVYTPTLLKMGLTATIGKGERSEEVIKSIAQNGSVYFCALGGAGALACQHIKECEVIAFDDLGCESVKRLMFDKFPLIVGIDSYGESVFCK